MTPLRQRIIEALQLRGLSERTQAMSVSAVRPRAAHDHQSPARLTAAARRDSFRSLTHGQHSARHARPMALGGITST
jgi:integrase/recombinase XerD